MARRGLLPPIENAMNMRDGSEVAQDDLSAAGEPTPSMIEREKKTPDSSARKRSPRGAGRLRPHLRHMSQDSSGESAASTAESAGGRAAWVAENLLAPGLLLVAILILTIRPVADPDSWFHLALGREFLRTGALPRGDLFSFTSPGGEWISSGWLPSVGMAWAYEKWGPAGLAWLVFAVIAPAYLLIYFVGKAAFRAPRALTLFLLAAMAAGYLRFTPRPDAWSQLFLAALTLILVTAPESPRRAAGFVPRRLWLLPFIMAAWANCHAGFLVGFVPLGFFAAARILEWRRAGAKNEWMWLAPIAACGFAWLLNPYGWEIAALAGKIKSIPLVKERILEWIPLLAFDKPAMPAFSYVGLTILFGFAAWAWAVGRASDRRAENLWRWALALFFVGLVFYQRRHLGIAAVGLVVSLLPELKGLESRLSRRRLLTPAAALAAVTAIGAVQSVGLWGVGRGLLETGVYGNTLPAFVTEFLRANRPPAQMFNTYGIGGYLLYHLSPESKVFIDGRLDVYEPRVWIDYMAIEDGKMSIDEAARKYDLNTFVLGIQGWTLDPVHVATRLAPLPDWAPVYYDDGFAVFVRRSGAGRDYADSLGYRFANPFRPEEFEKALANPATFKAALEEADRAVNESGGSGLSCALMAMAARRMGDEAGAREWTARVLSRDLKCPLLSRLQP